MAKLNHGAFSKAKGKLGGVVFQQYEGMQVAKEYQPNVMNPQTPSQMGARAKFKLASQLLALWKTILLASNLTSIYTRYRRAQVFKTILPYIEETSGDMSVDLTKVVGELNLSNSSAYTDVITSQREGNHGFELDFDPADGNTRTASYKVVAFNASGEVLGVYEETTEVVSSAFQPYNLPILPAEATVARYEVMVTAHTAVTDEGRAAITRMVENNATYINSTNRAVSAGDIVVSPIRHDLWSVA